MLDHRAPRRAAHRVITNAVHREGGKIAMQILHFGRYAYHPTSSSRQSRSRSPIARFTPPSTDRRASIEQTIDDYARCARLARAGRLRRRRDHGLRGLPASTSSSPPAPTSAPTSWGGSSENRRALPRRDRPSRPRGRRAPTSSSSTACRCSTSCPTGQSLDEVVALAREVEAAGATIINTGIGWHEARVPTIVDLGAARRLHLGHREAATRGHRSRSSPPTASTIPDLAEQLLADGSADLVSMARPFLADPDFVAKAAGGPRRRAINTCIACNQACLDHTFSEADHVLSGQPARRATRPSSSSPRPGAQARRRRGRRPGRTRLRRRAAERGHDVTLFDARPTTSAASSTSPAGSPARRSSTRRSATSARSSTCTASTCTLEHAAPTSTTSTDFDEVVVATGVSPRTPDDPRRRPPERRRLPDVLRDGAPVGRPRGRPRRRRHRLRRRRVPHRRRRQPSTTRARGCRSGASTDPDARAAVSPPPSARPAARGAPAPAQGHPGRRGPRQDDRLDPPHRAQAPGSHISPAASTTSASTTTDCTSPGERAHRPQVLDVDTIVLCTGQESAPRPVRRAAAPRRRGAPHRRRRRGRRARRQARHPPGHRARRPHLTGRRREVGTRRRGAVVPRQSRDRDQPALSFSFFSRS